MTDADNKDTSQADKSNSDGNKPDTLAEIRAQMEQLIQNQNQLTQTMASALKPQPRVEEEDEDQYYDPKKLRARVTQDTQSIIADQLRAEKAKDAMIWELAQEYPEIKSNQQIKNDILAAQKSLPENLRDTAVGYETAVLKAVSKAGLVPKSKRPTTDEDASFEPRGAGEARGNKKVKLSQNTLAIAELMGRNVNDPEVIKRLEAAANRDTYGKYR